jgi:hypothetical protein
MQDPLAILEAIEQGNISVQEGLQRLSGSSAEANARPAAAGVQRPAKRPLMARVIWQVVLWGGVLTVVVGGLLVAAVYAWAIPTGWRTAGWVLLGLGVVGLMLGGWLRTARWLSIRIREEEGTNITLAFPLPLGLAYWALRIARVAVPRLGDVPLEESVVALEETLRDGDPFFVDVHDEDDGDHVQVYFS